MNTNTKVFSLLGAFLVFLSMACDPCDDPGVVEIDFSDTSFPEVYWQVTTTSVTPGGIASSISLITTPGQTISMATNETVELELIGTDNQSGIKWMDIEGGFGYTCQQGNQAFAFSGIVPGNKIFYGQAETECGTAEANYPVFLIDGSSFCNSPGQSLTEGGYSLLGSANNNVDLTSGIDLQVLIVPASGS
ncbi:hypothetical protein [Lewinella sp. W8]|uniref:hypothetical protein n=1 Tax=Lewinella sp. W8 TaxID=2528208 RepID=UPI0010686156|nr:hypothetical protein [Lewinella sp. W8]MTB49949.1 hypothetical protein [Lewinella sp. W8]